MTAREYTNNLLNALIIFKGNNRGYACFEGKEGNLRLAREYGVGLRDFKKEEREEIIRSSYSILCVRFYDLKPFVDAKEWINEIYKAIYQSSK